MKLLLCLALTACASSTLDTRLQSAVTGVTYAQLAATSFDQQHERDIGATCVPGPDCTTKIATYHAARAKYDAAFSAAVAAIKVAITVKSNQTIAGVEAAAAIVAAELVTLGVH